MRGDCQWLFEDYLNKSRSPDERGDHLTHFASQKGVMTELRFTLQKGVMTEW
jgi:hypothetical protein